VYRMVRPPRVQLLLGLAILGGDVRQFTLDMQNRRHVDAA
jgi:hypothetical protein